jgi:pyruvate/2-oxoglutarate dehydrogenase complex dihydrolipoamide dehydrogenase (E3) component
MICDAAIIGAGTAGLAAERAARQAGAKTLLIDDRFTGTTCATVGCMELGEFVGQRRAHTNESSVAFEIFGSRWHTWKLRKVEHHFVEFGLEAAPDREQAKTLARHVSGT